MKKIILILLLLVPFHLKSVQLSLVTYNLWGLPYEELGAFGDEVAYILGVDPDDFDITKLDTHASERFERMIPILSKIDADLFLFQEGFDTKAIKKLRTGLKDNNIPYETKVLKRSFFSSGRLTNSGLLIMSRIPIETFDGIYYQDSFDGSKGISCLYSDCLADKGVLYAQVKKEGLTFHIFTTHTQAKTHQGDETPPPGTIDREYQFKRIKAFIDSKNIPATEPVIIAGDMNVDKRNPETRKESYEEYLAMKTYLNATEADPEDCDPSSLFNEEKQASYNSLGARIDYVFYSNDHLKPKSSSSIVLSDIQESDHMPVFATFEF